MYGKINGGTVLGIDGLPVLVEADAGDGLPGFEMVGYLGSEVREAKERVRTAIRNSGFLLPPQKMTVNLSPADLRKQGNYFDLPIAIAILLACGFLTDEMTKKSMFVGELGLDGKLLPINGALALADCAAEHKMEHLILPKCNASEAACCKQIKVIGADSLKEVVTLLHNPERIQYEMEGNVYTEAAKGEDFSELNGQEGAKRATEIAAAGMHNILYIGPPGSGKTMLAKRIPSIMPSMTRVEQIEISKVYSICGLLPKAEGLIRKRPFRSPHHTISVQALIGGGLIPRPGEVSLANGGVLFLDELPEFQKQVLESLRQPLEDRKVVISRVHGTYVYPTKMMLAAAMNPCPCGYYPDRERCKCSKGTVERYLNRISQPLLDRIDICIEAARISYQELTGAYKNESSETIRRRVEAAVDRQKQRYKRDGILFNSELTPTLQKKYCILGKEENAFLKEVFDRLGLSARAHSRIIRVARTIADLEGVERIHCGHLAEAIGYRNIDKKYWGS